MQFFHKKFVENLVNSKKSSTFALAFEKDILFSAQIRDDWSRTWWL